MAYIDGQPVEVPLKPIQVTVAHVEDGEIIPDTPDFSAGGVSAADAADALATVSKAWADISITMEMAAEGIREFFHAMEPAAEGIQKFFNAIVLAVAVRCAMVLEPAMAHRYLHTKKKRIRKKYEKRIMAWYREVFL